MSFLRDCSVCKSKFRLSPCFVKDKYKNRGKYCSRKCMAKGFETSIFKYCLICNKKFKVYLSQLKFGTRNYCSHRCKGIAHKANVKGSKNPMYGRIRELSPRWKGGIRSDYLERRRFHREIQKVVFERDNYTCQICGIRGIALQVDHIKPWAKYMELRFEIKNCRTLCFRCHYFITFGKPIAKNVKGWGHNFFKGGY